MQKPKHFSLDNSKTLKDDRRKNWFWDSNEIFSSNLSAYAKLVRLYLARCADSERRAFPSYNRIARDCGISRDTAKRAVAELEEKGWVIKITQIKDDGEYLSNIYSLCDPPKPAVNDVQGGGCCEHPPCPDLEGVGAVSTHVGAVGTQVGAETASNNTNITKTKEQDITIIHSSVQNNKDNNRARAKSRKAAVDNVDCVDKQKNLSGLENILKDAGFDGTRIEVEYVAQWANFFTKDMIRYAVKKSVLSGKKSLPYIGGIFESWLEKGIVTIEQAESETRFDSYFLKSPP
ncbi:MAG: helix-turn-helix domain-containing protein [Peptococcaceae bacterium]|nr:helix-turn-helix domain-containing protein [Peptococcaceae bacterium]